MTDHPITPPPELVEQWTQEWLDSNWIGKNTYIATQAARWGADQELEAVEEELITQGWFANSAHRLAQLRAARRPKPPSLKEQALQILDVTQKGWGLAEVDLDTIRRALEALPE